MTTSLAELIGTRRRLAVERAAELADQLEAGDSRSVAKQTEIETALADVRHYRSLEVDLRAVADETGIYNRRSDRSVIKDLRSQSSEARARITASHRATAADAGLEARDLGAGTTIAAVPAWLLAEARPLSIVRAPMVATIARPLPRVGLELRMPVFSTEPTAGPQTALNAAVASASFVDAGVDAPVRTFAAQVNVSVQMLDQSPIAIDAHVLPSMVAAVDAAIEESLWTGDGDDGHVVGLLEADDTSSETYTSTAPSLVTFVPALEALVRKVETAGGSGGAPVVAMHPRRLSWLRQTAAVEGRDLGWTPAPFDGATVGLFGGSVAVVADPAAPTTLGTGTNEDAVVAMRSLDVVDLFASAPRVRVFDGPSLSGTLTATIVVSRMVAFSAERLPAAVGVLSGTGLAAPA